MRSVKCGKNTLKIEVTNISQFGFWIYFKEKEYYLDYKHFPWFKDASVNEISTIECLFGENFHWPELDVDLDLKRIISPDLYPLKSRIGDPVRT